MNLIVFLSILFCLNYKTYRKMEKFYKGVFPLCPKKYFASVMICIFYTKYAYDMIGQRGERSPTAKNMNVPKQNLHNDSAIHCTLHDSSN